MPHECCRARHRRRRPRLILIKRRKGKENRNSTAIWQMSICLKKLAPNQMCTLIWVVRDGPGLEPSRFFTGVENLWVAGHSGALLRVIAPADGQSRRMRAVQGLESLQRVLRGDTVLAHQQPLPVRVDQNAH